MLPLLLLSTLVSGEWVGAAPSVANCTEKWTTYFVDNWAYKADGEGVRATFGGRYFEYKAFYEAGGPLLFYTGNEAGVEVYINNTGLMWDLARELKGLLVFAEHRYYGESQPFPEGHEQPGCRGWLTTEQALADYARLIGQVRKEYGMAASTAVVAFGGSYGGMLSAYFRLKFPHVVDGAISASAPVYAMVGLDPPIDPSEFNHIIAKVAGPACAGTFRRALQIAERMLATEDGRRLLEAKLSMCAELSETSPLLAWLTEPWNTLAMSNFPYPSDYVTRAVAGVPYPLPAWPMKAACQPLEEAESEHRAEALFEAVRRSVSVWYNVSGNVACYNVTPPSPPAPSLWTNGGRRANHSTPTASLVGGCGGDWGYQACVDYLMPFAQGTPRDMFWPPIPFDLPAALADCKAAYGVEVEAGWGVVEYGDWSLAAHLSNVVFSNGLLDPWSGWGVDCTKVACGKDVSSVFIELGAHHLDLMFPHPDDPDCVKAARETERAAVRRWVSAKATRVTPEQVLML